MRFDVYVGIDYSGRGTPETRTSAIQVYRSTGDEPKRVSPPGSDRRSKHWCRRDVAGWLCDILQGSERKIVGIDHGFSFPIRHFRSYRLRTWNAFLNDFCSVWQTDQQGRTVDEFRESSAEAQSRLGRTTELRLCEQWTSSAKSVFLFDVQGSVAKSTHAGIPWLAHLREQLGEELHFWPFDGFDPPSGVNVIAEVFPSLFRQRYPRQDRSVDEHDAFCVARWLAQTDRLDHWNRYFDPPLTRQDRNRARLEGWILGVA